MLLEDKEAKWSWHQLVFCFIIRHYSHRSVLDAFIFMLFSKISELILGWSQDFPKEVKLPGCWASPSVPALLPWVTAPPWRGDGEVLLCSFWRRAAGWDTTTSHAGAIFWAFHFISWAPRRAKKTKRERKTPERDLPSFADQLYSQKRLLLVRTLICKRRHTGSQNRDPLSALTFCSPCQSCRDFSSLLVTPATTGSNLSQNLQALLQYKEE